MNKYTAAATAMIIGIAVLLGIDIGQEIPAHRMEWQNVASFLALLAALFMLGVLSGRQDAKEKSRG